jgi:alpha-mannosidase
MSLTAEWNDRIETWRRNLNAWLYEPIGTMPVSGFCTMDRLSQSDARKQKFRPMKEGTPWGVQWEYGWFKGSITLPKTAQGRHIVFHDPRTVESIIYLNGILAGSTNHGHPYPTLALKGRAGQSFELLMELYAGHGAHPPDGPLPKTPTPTLQPGVPQRHVPKFTYGIWHEEAYQLHIDLETLVRLRKHLNPTSLQIVRIDAALKAFTSVVDFEAAPEEVRASFTRARKLFAPLFKAKNGTNAPDFFCFGHGHLDTAWLWPLAECERKVARTISEQLNLIDMYPGYKFLMSQPAQHEMIKQLYPELYRRMKVAVKKGGIIADGGMWVEADTNVPSGESLIRQFMYGKRHFKDEYGVDSRLLWLPDVFGYSAALPQIMKGCGIDYFTTAKIFWNYHGEEVFPYHNFIWEGLDGTEIVAHIHEHYNSFTDPLELAPRWPERKQKDNISTRLYPFGWGDGGGGPARDHLEHLTRARDMEGLPKCRIAPPVAFFEDLIERGEHNVNRYVGELYYTCHRGTYTSQARTKLGNRRSEIALREAELWSAVASHVARFKTPVKQLEAAWKTLLLNQFHDILPGSSIERVYIEAEAQLKGVINDATTVARKAMAALGKNESNVITVFNSLGWKRTELVALPAGMKHPALASGQGLPIQTLGNTRLVEVLCRPCGVTSIRSAAPTTAPVADPRQVKASSTRMENELLQITLNDQGVITRILDKETGFLLSSGLCNELKMFKDVPSAFDAWDIDSQYVLDPVKLDEKAAIRVLTQGPLFAVVEIKRRLANSTMIQEIWLRRDSRRIDFKTRIDWREKHRLLKVGFATDIHAREGLHEVQFGHFPRPTHQSTQYDKERYEVSAHKWSALVESNRGVAVLNDCKYGVNILGKSINLTLLRSPASPDANADQGLQIFTYSFFAWNGNFTDSGLVHEAYNLNVPTTLAEGFAGDESFLSIDSGSIIIDTVKQAEDDTSALIVRMYESSRTATAADLTTLLPIANADLVDMLEGNPHPIKHRANKVTLVFKPFEVKTLRLTFKR